MRYKLSASLMNCKVCNKGFMRTSNGQKYCPDCREEAWKQKESVWKKSHSLNSIAHWKKRYKKYAPKIRIEALTRHRSKEKEERTARRAINIE